MGEIVNSKNIAFVFLEKKRVSNVCFFEMIRGAVHFERVAIVRYHNGQPLMIFLSLNDVFISPIASVRGYVGGSDIVLRYKQLMHDYAAMNFWRRKKQIVRKESD